MKFTRPRSARVVFDRRGRVQAPPTISDRLGGAVDRVVGIFSPAAALRRAEARARAGLLSQAWQGAAGSRTWENRSGVTSGSADGDLDGATLATLRERSRHLVRNAPGARAMTSTLADNIVGSGLRPRLALPWKELGITRERARELAVQASRIWRRWNETADAQNRLTFLQMQHVAVSSTMVNGDAFALPMFVDDARVRCRYQLKVELVEGDRVDTPHAVDLSGRDIRNGVELGARAQPVAYWIHTRHPGDPWRAGQVGARRMRRYAAHTPSGRPAVLHIFDAERIGQSRGAPVLASTLDYWQHVADYIESELVAANVAACVAGFVRQPLPDAAFSARTLADGQGNRVEEMVPGTIEYLEPGQEITFLNPGRPNAQFAPFVDKLFHLIASSLGMSYPIATRDFAGTTYSQARADLLEAWRMFQRRQRWIVGGFCQPIWRMLLEEAWLLGDFDAPPTFLDEIELWTATQWVAPGRGWIDPAKEVGAYAQALEIGVTDRAEIIAASSGRDVDDVTEQLAYEADLRAELLPAAPEASSAGNEDDEDTGDDTQEDEGDTEDEGDEAEQ